MSPFRVLTVMHRNGDDGIRVVEKGIWKEREVGKSEVGKFRCSCSD